ncbi:6-phosphogluconolactonase [Nevskia sp.]|uniref:6-phosphogluconolactonase n=1 Tax=Nevskia sp. TaxID=1929292 RepID=UPI0025D10A4D|nr:6-phosphogluconolactonase [Nevskia sp.]
MALFERTLADGDALPAAVAASVADDLRAAIAQRSQASLVVSGGRSPVPFFAALRRADVDWSRVWITLADERWVPPSAADSNERLLREHLLIDGAAAARFIGLKSAFDTPETGLAATRAALAAIPRPFDVVVLGMGEDGHTASLFPGAAGLAQALDVANADVVAAITPLTAPHPRITLTLAALLDARRIVLPLSGAAKLAVYRAAVAADGDPLLRPIAAVLQQRRVPVEVWIVDPAVV